MVYGHLFTDATEAELASLKRMGLRWKQYEKEGKWVYEQHAFWCSGFTYWLVLRNDTFTLTTNH